MLNVAIVGCGWVSDWHVADGIAHLPDRYRLLAACDNNPERLDAFASRYNTPRKVASYDELLAMHDIDVVAICTPPSLHYPMVMAALAAGKDVVCEKPFVASLAEADAVIEQQKHSRGRCMPIFNYRFGDGIARVRHVITSGLAGRHYVSSAETAKRRGPDYYAVAWRGKFATELGGVLLTQAIHTHDLLLWLIGSPAEVSCFKTTRVNPIETEDCAVATLRMTDGSLASITATLGSARQVVRLRLCFENVTFERVADDMLRPGDEPWTIIPKTEEIGRAIEAKLAELEPQHSWFVRQYELFADTIERGTPLPVTLEDARASIELITAMFESDETKSVVHLPIGAGHPKYEGWIPSSARSAPRKTGA